MEFKSVFLDIWGQLVRELKICRLWQRVGRSANTNRYETTILWAEFGTAAPTLVCFLAQYS